ncbi:putative Thioredoxin [Trypanosoma vivax]|uniref:Thioredoxin domain-containing protein n=1 Tax=Trypanosoma vivax (strain Y486) TaxID=1055687 RepID=G0U3B0_TRYVY|nr:hypothetical protein TRVL_00915 [Trypanosoma vivax]KAH8604230.1 putative Thioredoxin [Trypanosoma vivax]CCC50766.1 conserved hypothetical protein [Trypanosoma vivax Y486]
MPAKKRVSKKSAPPPPPPVVLHASTLEEFGTTVERHEGPCLVAVVTSFCNYCAATVLPYLENLNSTRTPAMSKLNIVVIEASTQSSELCKSLGVKAIPTFFCYSYGKQVLSFQGDNVNKALLLAKIAIQRAEEDKIALDAAAAAAAAAAANGDTVS